MVSSSSLREQKRIDMSTSFQVLKTIINSKSMNTDSILYDAMLYIKDLELQIEAITREFEGMTSNNKEVKVEKNGNKFTVRVTCKKKEYLLFSIIEAFEKLDLIVLHVNTTYEQLFVMEAIFEDENQVHEVKDVTNVILIAIDM